jgi:serine/threonine protein kinase
MSADDDDRTVIRPSGAGVVPVTRPGTPSAPAAPEPGPPGSSGANPDAPTEMAAPAAPAAPTPADTTRFAPTAWSSAPPPAPLAAGADDHGNGLPPGTWLGEFELTSMVGEGGFGIVYLATDHSLQRRVALKEYMPSALAARTQGSQVQVRSARHQETFQAGLKSFVNEARLLAQFDHPSLVKVYRFWEANGTAYMVMPFYEGQTLRDLLRSMDGPPDETWLRQLLDPLTEALAVIHAEQCYHRDIAPDNVMMLSGGPPNLLRPLLLDFGAARRVIGDMTQALTVILKPGYAPVEQYAEIPGLKQGPWTDVYALAAVVYFAITGKTPPPSVGRMLNDTYVPLAESAAGRYSAGFLQAIDRALQVRPEARTQSIGALREALALGPTRGFDPYTTLPLPPDAGVPSRATDSAAVPAPRPASPMPAAAAGRAAATASAASPGGGSRTPLWIAAAAAAVLAAAVGLYTWLAPAPREAEPAPVAAVPSPPAAGSAPAVSPPAAEPPLLQGALPGRIDVAREFERVLQAATPGHQVSASAPQTRLRIDRDEFAFNVSSDRGGYLYVFGHSPDGTLAQLVPNLISGAVRLQPGQAWRFPIPGANPGDAEFRLDVVDPPGRSSFLVVVSQWQRSLDELATERADPIRLIPTEGPAAARVAAHPGPGSLVAGRLLCPEGQACADSYGAALLHFEAVR